MCFLLLYQCEIVIWKGKTIKDKKKSIEDGETNSSQHETFLIPIVVLFSSGIYLLQLPDFHGRVLCFYLTLSIWPLILFVLFFSHTYIHLSLYLLIHVSAQIAISAKQLSSSVVQTCVLYLSADHSSDFSGNNSVRCACLCVCFHR